MITQLNNFDLSVYGLILNYYNNGRKYIIELDPNASCDLMVAAGFIEGFSSDNNGEPVILFTDNSKTWGYDGQLWFEFVKSFNLSFRLAEILADTKARMEQSEITQNTINRLLQPLQAA